MELWIALAHVRPHQGRNSDFDFVGLYQYIGGPATSSSEFEKLVRETFEGEGFFLVDLDQVETAQQYRDERCDDADIAAFVKEVETRRVLIFGPGFGYEADDD